MYEILIFRTYISHKKEIKVNNLTPDYGQNLPTNSLKIYPKEPKLFLKSQNLFKISSKMFSYCILSFLHYLKYKNFYTFFLFPELHIYCKEFRIFFNLENWGRDISMPPIVSVTL